MWEVHWIFIRGTPPILVLLSLETLFSGFLRIIDAVQEDPLYDFVRYIWITYMTEHHKI